VNQALQAYQKFGFAEVAFFDENDTSVYNALAQNMMEARPAHLAVVDPGWTMGHNVVVDGYNTDDYFHLNFGWGGPYNGWYLLPDEIPYGLTVIEGAIADIAYPPVNTGIYISDYDQPDLNLHIYPNPATDQIHVSFTLPQKSVVKTEIYDSKGALFAYEKESVFEKGPHTRTLILSDPGSGEKIAGLYLLKMIVNGHVSTESFLVQ
jgi:hypothetical protein